MLISTHDWPYRIITSITEPDGDTYKQYVEDFETWNKALEYFAAANCSLRVIGYALVRKSDGAYMHRKGWLYGADSENFTHKRIRS